MNAHISFTKKNHKPRKAILGTFTGYGDSSCYFRVLAKRFRPALYWMGQRLVDTQLRFCFYKVVKSVVPVGAHYIVRDYGAHVPYIFNC